MRHGWRATQQAGGSTLLLCALAMTPLLAEAGCNMAVLQQLGWQLSEGAQQAPRMTAGDPCRRAS
ncbi:MAG: hypothetical protein RR326_04015, partial [Stenotrophomonas sp.]